MKISPVDGSRTGSPKSNGFILEADVVDLMKLQPQTEHPHGLSDMDFDDLYTKDKPVIFAFHAYRWLIHRLTYRRTNHDNIHVRGYKEEGTITTPFDKTVLNDLDRFHLVMDTIDRLPQTGDKEEKHRKLLEHVSVGKVSQGKLDPILDLRMCNVSLIALMPISSDW